LIPIAEIRTPPRNCVKSHARAHYLGGWECPHNVFVSTCCVHKVLLDRNLKPRVCPLHVCTCVDRVYSEILAYCTRAIYPPRFLQTAPSWGARVFHRLWLGHMFMESKGLPMHSPRSPVYGEILACCTRAVYPPRFLRTVAHRWASVFLWLWLGHMYMGNKGFTSGDRLFSPGP
jgi:hypothetical protein